MNAKVKEWNDKTAIEKILTVRGTGLREEIYDVALAELAAKDAELAALRQVVEAARYVVGETHGVYDDSVPDTFKTHLTVGDIRYLAAALERVKGTK